MARTSTKPPARRVPLEPGGPYAGAKPPATPGAPSLKNGKRSAFKKGSPSRGGR